MDWRNIEGERYKQLYNILICDRYRRVTVVQRLKVLKALENQPRGLPAVTER